MNLYNSPDPAKAEIVLAEVWAKSAKREGHQRALPHVVKANTGKPGVHAKIGAIDSVRAYARSASEPFTTYQLALAFPKFNIKQLRMAVQQALTSGELEKVGRKAKGLSAYIWTGV